MTESGLEFDRIIASLRQQTTDVLDSFAQAAVEMASIRKEAEQHWCDVAPLCSHRNELAIGE